EQLPPRRLPVANGTPPPPRAWAEKDPAAAKRLEAVRGTVRALAESHDVPQENLLAPATQRQLAWRPPEVIDEDTVRAALEEQGARPWQVELTHGPLTEALRSARAATPRTRGTPRPRYPVPSVLGSRPQASDAAPRPTHDHHHLLGRSPHHRD